VNKPFLCANGSGEKRLVSCGSNGGRRSSLKVKEKGGEAQSLRVRLDAQGVYLEKPIRTTGGAGPAGNSLDALGVNWEEGKASRGYGRSKVFQQIEITVQVTRGERSPPEATGRSLAGRRRNVGGVRVGRWLSTHLCPKVQWPQNMNVKNRRIPR